ncbi:pleckstrin homology domain-containing family F member 1 [Hypomesus transpacificus]|uniref:pleckstrin homology domain-containing family F member 1 n=1 Tax=Hypomesus transpacificus TaxID=137520 RepID=UPI001F073892|nr:pleckstrin homology domain-containing family F member 1 [Hypomesus transpacificus]
MDQENFERIRAVENSFRPPGKPLANPGRVLVGEGRLMKLCRHRPMPRVFFLFNDVLVYGSIILNGRWNKRQQIIPLEDIELEDLEDGLYMKNQWLIKTPRKSFFVSATSSEEKQAWMEHIEDCRTKWLQKAGRKPSNAFAVTWIPDRASAICMRCFGKFNITHRRHHCRSCGFVVCSPCSKARAVLPHISSKPVRICKRCTLSLQDQGVGEHLRPRGDSDGTNCVSDEDDQLAPEYEPSSDEEEWMEDRAPSNCVDSQLHSTSTYVFLNPDHERPAMT